MNDLEEFLTIKGSVIAPNPNQSNHSPTSREKTPNPPSHFYQTRPRNLDPIPSPHLMESVISFDSPVSLRTVDSIAIFFSLSAVFCSDVQKSLQLSIQSTQKCIALEAAASSDDNSHTLQTTLKNSFWIGSRPFALLLDAIDTPRCLTSFSSLFSSDFVQLFGAIRFILHSFARYANLGRSELALALVLLCRAVLPLSNAHTDTKRTIGHLTKSNAGTLLLISVISACKHLRDNRVSILQIANTFHLNRTELLKSEISFYSALNWCVSSIESDLQLMFSFFDSIEVVTDAMMPAIAQLGPAKISAKN
ncbi:hypothetical protein BLNAU_13844 [Blattamonas nauphoetae]|uniref:Cyclin N-terminal domain-containing protein n=1 Tax=Blattamonas nauphoetae TaxID=2049346 RepID=A0ABQ9XIS3_9EUKA|nr:hypothetical protein BLNAU_13844 [Blattamonas nauphoetae]